MLISTKVFVFTHRSHDRRARSQLKLGKKKEYLNSGPENGSYQKMFTQNLEGG